MCVKWNSSLFRVFKACFGVRQGFVLSPYLFSVYIDDITKLHNPRLNVFVILYADDILLISPSVTCLQKLLWHCEQEFNDLDMVINDNNSCCMRINCLIKLLPSA